MNARRYTVRLFWYGTRRHQEDRNLDPRDAAALRAVLEEMVEASNGNLRTDLSRWRIDIHTLGGGRIHARCTVTPGGQTKVTR
ncbi:hypothetical protein OOJ91_33960 [Micromonospora lupini]|uniref:hypothetical protein n=1 Tax=Micromonospora lupini TaxID=285679 RepID=UPI00225665BE|nr:hypothetical protein [Micromonospora lupini]MCX5070854.1 hypothetical protein [Micromonospora lupini]